MVDEHDPHVNALGIKGVGEIGAGVRPAPLPMRSGTRPESGCVVPIRIGISYAGSKLNSDEHVVGDGAHNDLLRSQQPERLSVTADPKRSADTQMPLNCGLFGAQPALFCPLDYRT